MNKYRIIFRPHGVWFVGLTVDTDFYYSELTGKCFPLSVFTEF